ncbi:hypothetical protein [Streptomyces gardneri]|uniref:hypothetical protein n=1 Tax=Streptomyces gardneri TaxID=66892 RepID=UPI0035DA7044
MDLCVPYLLLERPQIVAAAQRTLRRQADRLFVVQCVEGDGTHVRGRLDGVMVTRVVRGLEPDLWRIAVREMGGGLDPLALLVGRGGRMLTGSEVGPGALAGPVVGVRRGQVPSRGEPPHTGAASARVPHRPMQFMQFRREPQAAPGQGEANLIQRRHGSRVKSISGTTASKR